MTGGSFIDDGTTLNVPDYVFKPEYKLESIEEHSDYMWQEKHLPAVKSAKAINDSNGYNMAERREQILEELEKAHVYIVQLHDTIKELKAENSTTKTKLSEIEAALQKLDILTAKKGNEKKSSATETAEVSEGSE